MGVIIVSIVCGVLANLLTPSVQRLIVRLLSKPAIAVRLLGSRVIKWRIAQMTTEIAMIRSYSADFPKFMRLVVSQTLFHILKLWIALFAVGLMAMGAAIDSRPPTWTFNDWPIRIVLSLAAFGFVRDIINTLVLVGTLDKVSGFADYKARSETEIQTLQELVTHANKQG